MRSGIVRHRLNDAVKPAVTALRRTNDGGGEIGRATQGSCQPPRQSERKDESWRRTSCAKAGLQLWRLALSLSTWTGAEARPFGLCWAAAPSPWFRWRLAPFRWLRRFRRQLAFHGPFGPSGDLSCRIRQGGGYRGFGPAVGGRYSGSGRGRTWGRLRSRRGGRAMGASTVTRPRIPTIAATRPTAIPAIRRMDIEAVRWRLRSSACAPGRAAVNPCGRPLPAARPFACSSSHPPRRDA